jgi:hypothetical protein
LALKLLIGDVLSKSPFLKKALKCETFVNMGYKCDNIQLISLTPLDKKKLFQEDEQVTSGSIAF